jgi:hypothetical protein
MAASQTLAYKVDGDTTAGYPNGLLIGDRIADKLPVKAIRITAAVAFTALGVLTVAGVDRSDALYPVTAVRPTVATAQILKPSAVSLASPGLIG